MTVTYNNPDDELIVNFMELTPQLIGQSTSTAKIENLYYWGKIDLHVHAQPLFSSSWDWLMPVLEKIHKSKEYCAPAGLRMVGIDVEVSPNHCSIFYPNTKGGYDWVDDCWNEPALFSCHFVCETTIEAAYKAAVRYIKWYNENK